MSLPTCINCGIDCFVKPLHRTNPEGQEDPGWMCIRCIEKSEPELAENIKQDEIFKIANIIKPK